jgi:hypothetical protein
MLLFMKFVNAKADSPPWRKNDTTVAIGNRRNRALTDVMMSSLNSGMQSNCL